jgi:hypothetical protein
MNLPWVLGILTHVNTISKQTHAFWQLGKNIAIIGI